MPHTGQQQLIADLLPTLRRGEHPRDQIEEMCSLILSDDEETAAYYSAAFFSNLIEPLCDSFLASDVSIYNRLFARVIDSSRQLARGRPLDKALDSCGLKTEDQLVERASRLCNVVEVRKFSDQAATLTRVILLSRVTLGADVAISSVIVERLERMLPDAEIVLVGPRKLRELFGGDRRIRFETIEYRRTGTVLDRLLAFAELHERLHALNGDLSDGEYLIIDPDSRLTQLGLLPATEDSNYLFFPSRSYKSDTAKSLAQLTSDWLDEVTGETSPALPGVRLSSGDQKLGRRLVSAMRETVPAPIATLNFGVGENDAKRLGHDFESSLIAGLLGEGVRVILDKGASVDEQQRADAALLAASQMRPTREASAVELTESNLADHVESLRAGASRVVTWTGRIGLLGALIGESDIYIGYDSAGQHIAAALGVRCIDVFAGAEARFRQRWSPTGPSECVVVPATRSDCESALSQVLASARRLI